MVGGGRLSLSTHVLDISIGRPAAELAVALERLCDAQWTRVTEAMTDTNGRCGELLTLAGTPEAAGIYRLRFNTAAYFARRNQLSLYPYIDIVFTIADDQHHHIPLLMTANSYTTYRGS